MMAQDARIDGVDGTQTIPDITGALVPVQPLAQYQSQLQPDPGHHYPDVDLQIFGDPRAPDPNMQGFIKASYLNISRSATEGRQSSTTRYRLPNGQASAGKQIGPRTEEVAAQRTPESRTDNPAT
jgi:hypothetical protein